MKYFGVFLAILAMVFSGPALAQESTQATDDVQYSDQPCWSGQVIIGEGEHAGYIEFLGCSGLVPKYRPMEPMTYERESLPARSYLVKVDDQGRYMFPTIPGRKPDPNVQAYLTLNEADQAPTFHAWENGQEKMTASLYPVYDHSWAMKEGKITPLIAPDILPAFEVVERKKGQIIGEGRVFHISPLARQ